MAGAVACGAGSLADHKQLHFFIASTAWDDSVAKTVLARETDQRVWSIVVTTPSASPPPR